MLLTVRLDPHKRATALMSLPRDLLVDIPGHGRQKLNAAFAFGEDRLTLRTVRDLLKIPIHHYVRVTFWGFTRGRRPPRLRLRRRRPRVLQRQPPAQRRRRRRTR